MKFPRTTKSKQPPKHSKRVQPSKFNHKHKNAQKRQPQVQYPDNDESIHSSQVISNNENFGVEENPQKYMSAEDVRLNIAKQLLQTTKKTVKSKNLKQDDFFMAEPNQQIDEEERVVEQLKNQYLKSKNKLYNNLTEEFSALKIDRDNVIRYKGHKRCITAIQVLDQTIFSCSKDRSIIKWDRETGKKDFVTKGESDIVVGDHVGPILALTYHPNLSLLATAGEDGLIKLWDVRAPKAAETLKGHRGAVTGIKFGANSNNLCSVSTDKTFKQWDCSQRGLIQTYYGHNYQILDLDSINDNDFISSGNDHQTIVWKTQKQTQLVFQGHDYAIDRVRAINDEKFVTGCQDGSLYLWSQKKKKQIFKNQTAHEGWVCSLSSLRQTNIVASGDSARKIKIWGINDEMKGMTLLHEIESAGIVTDLSLRKNELVASVGDECRLGRWWSHRVRNQIEVYRFKEE